MRRSKKMMVAVLASAMVIGGALTGYAENLGNGQWSTGAGENANKYWFNLAPDGSSFIANTWHWVKDADGVIRCYYFDQNGWALTNTTIDGAQLDANGSWVENGKTVTGDESKKYYTQSASFGAAAQPQQSQQTAPAVSAQTQPTGNKNAVKGSGKGDAPAAATADALPYTLSSISGNDVTNDWANFKISFSSIGKSIQAGNADNRQDFSISDDVSELTARFLPLDQYQAGNQDLNAFINAYIADAREGMKGAKVVADIQLGAYSFKQVEKSVPNPTIKMADHTYFRIVDGTNYVQVLSVKQNGESQDFLSALKTIQKVR